MDYEKKYDEALEKARSIIEYYVEHKRNDVLPYIKEDLEGIFPELRESEDEKIKKTLIDYFITYKKQEECGIKTFFGIPTDNVIAWVEKQGNKVIDCPQNYQDSSRPNGCIVLEDFYGGEGFYKLNLDYLNEKQVEEVEEMVRTWNKESKTSNENIKNCIGMCLTDTDEQRFKDFNTNLKDCLYWLEKSNAELKKNKTCKENDDSLTSEDEKIRKDLIAIFKGEIPYTSEEDAKRYIAWIEKQGEPKSVDKEYTFKAIPRLLDMIKPTEKAKAYCQKLIDTLKKEGYHTDAKIVGECLRGMNGENVAMAVMDEQPITDKVEPKFKVGDWIVNNLSKDVFLIKSFNNGYCTLEDIKGNIISPCLPPCESESHLWTIQDAKDGDVLKEDSCIFIINKMNANETAIVHCCLFDDGEFDLGSTLSFDVDSTHPATKEQRDTLFAKMKEAGYEWDAEKKELKKIEKCQWNNFDAIRLKEDDCRGNFLIK